MIESDRRHVDALLALKRHANRLAQADAQFRANRGQYVVRRFLGAGLRRLVCFI